MFNENRFQSGRRVGFTTGVCTSRPAPPIAFQCQAIARIGGDQLTAQTTRAYAARRGAARASEISVGA